MVLFKKTYNVALKALTNEKNTHKKQYWLETTDLLVIKFFQVLEVEGVGGFGVLIDASSGAGAARVKDNLVGLTQIRLIRVSSRVNKSLVALLNVIN